VCIKNLNRRRCLSGKHSSGSLTARITRFSKSLVSRTLWLTIVLPGNHGTCCWSRSSDRRSCLPECSSWVLMWIPKHQLANSHNSVVFLAQCLAKIERLESRVSEDWNEVLGVKLRLYKCDTLTYTIAGNSLTLIYIRSSGCNLLTNQIGHWHFSSFYTANTFSYIPNFERIVLETIACYII